MALAPRTLHDMGIGILMLDTRFPRFHGDIGNAGTWNFPVQFKIVKGADPKRVVYEGAQGLLPPFVEAARELVDLGVRGISTSCGFLALFQKEMAAQLPVPVATSSLLQIPLINAMLPAGKRAGIVTASARSLTAKHLEAVGVDPSTPIVGMSEATLFYQLFGKNMPDGDQAVLRDEIVAAAVELATSNPDIGAIVLECTNMAPYSEAIARRTGLPVYDIIGFIDWFARSLNPPTYRTASPASQGS